jgi:hypothetical protein
MNIQILSKPDNNVVAEGTLDLKSCELKIEPPMDAEKFKSFSDAFLENGNFKPDIISSCEKEDSSFKFGFLNRKIKGFLMKKKPLPSLNDVDGGRRKTRRVRKARKTRKARK